MNSNNDPGRGCLADVITECTLPDDALYIGSKSVPGGVRGWSNPWKVKGSTVQAQQKAVGNFGNMLSSPFGRWLRWQLHEVRSKVL